MIDHNTVVSVLQNIYDPEVPVNIYDLGLIYNIEIEETIIHITMSLTSPFCPAADMILADIDYSLREAGASGVTCNITFDPPWGPDRISDEGKLELGLL